MFQFPGFASTPYVFRCRYLLRGGFPHSEILGSKLVCQLPGAYRRLLRPSSPPAAKASTARAYSLDHITPNILSLDDQDIAIDHIAVQPILLRRWTAQVQIGSSWRVPTRASTRKLFIVKEHQFPFWERNLSYTTLLVEPSGVEPLTSCVQSRRSTN